MATKPSVVPTWATDTNFTNGPAAVIGTPTKVAPSAGVRAEGWIPNTAPGAQHENYEKNLIGQWLDYLDDGQLTGPHQVTSNSVGNVALYVIQQQTDQVAFRGEMPAGATVAAGHFDGGLEVIPGAVASPRGLLQRAQAPIALRDTEEYRYCDSAGALTTKTRQIMIPLSSAKVSGSGWVLSAPGGAPGHAWSVLLPVTADKLLWEPRLPQGVTVTEVKIGVKQETDNGTDMTMQVFSLSYDKTDGGTALESTVASLGSDTWTAAGATADDILSVSLSHSVTATNGLLIELRASAGGGAGGIDWCYWVEITYSDPGPRLT